VEVIVSAPFAGPVSVRARGTDHAIARELAARIGVVPE
jgi:Fe2+ transport system protein FeoA